MGAAKAILRGTVMVVNDFIKKEGSEINNLTLHLKEVGKEQTKCKAIKKKEIIKIRGEINKE